EFDPAHHRHMDVGDQAGRFGETRGCEEIGRRWKSLDGIAQRPHAWNRERTDHLQRPKPIAFASRRLCSSLEPAVRAAQQCRRSAWDDVICAKNAIGAMPVPRKLWLVGETF